MSHQKEMADGIVNGDDEIGSIAQKISSDLAKIAQKSRQGHYDIGKSHDSKFLLSKRGSKEFAHARSTDAVELAVGPFGQQLLSNIGPVQISAGLTSAYEYVRNLHNIPSLGSNRSG